MHARRQRGALPEPGTEREPRAGGGRTKRLGQLPGVRKARVRVLGERAHAHVLDGSRHVLHATAQRPRRVVDVLHEHRHGRGGVEGRAPGEQLVEEDADGVDVAPRVRDLTGGALGGDVASGAEDHAGLRHHGLVVPEQARDAEVEDLHEVGVAVPGDDVHVLGLHVAVHDALAVGVPHGGGDLRGEVKRPPQRQGSFLAQQRGEAAPLEELHDQVKALIVGELAKEEDAHEVGVLERRGDARFAVETAHRVRVLRQLRMEDLDGHVAAEGRLRRPVDRAHAALPHGLVDAELAEKDGADEGVRRAHGGGQARAIPLAEERPGIVRGAANGADLRLGGHGNEGRRFGGRGRVRDVRASAGRASSLPLHARHVEVDVRDAELLGVAGWGGGGGAALREPGAVPTGGQQQASWR